MKKKAHNGLGNGVFYLVPLAVCLGTSAPVWAAPLKAWQYDPTANQLEVTLKDGVKPRYFLMARPARIVLDLPDTEVGDVQRQQTYKGAVRQVRVSQVKPGLTRIVLELSPDVTLMRGQAQLQRVGDAEPSSDRWVLRPLITQALTNPLAAIPSLPPTPAQLPPTAIQYPPGMSPSETGGSARQVDRSIAPVSDKPIDIAVPPPATVAPIATNPPSTKAPLVAAESAPKIANLPTPPAPENFPPGIAPTPEQPTANPTPSISSAPPAQVPAIEPASRIAQKPAPSLQLPDINPSLAIPDSLPPVTAPDVPTAPTVSVPPLDRSRVSPNLSPELP
ncbi:MAG: AMIN domain-containing protein, partial [Phormidesmis sp. CAN_BIN44]|nr:AMIN domain-containing protein [Phormidesmis sp. CAN_BIN44]